MLPYCGLLNQSLSSSVFCLLVLYVAVKGFAVQRCSPLALNSTSSLFSIWVPLDFGNCDAIFSLLIIFQISTWCLTLLGLVQSISTDLFFLYSLDISIFASFLISQYGPDDIRPVHSDILIAKLRPGQVKL